MKYCSSCGFEVTIIVPPDDNRERYVCRQCNTVHYQNPKIVAGCIPEWNDQILLCKRAIEPRSGLWTLPAGFMELGETTHEAAVRETLEEANARVELLDLFMVINLPYVNQVYMMFRSRLLEGDFSPGPESLEVGLYRREDIPWEALAFPTIRETLHCYYEDRERGDYRLHTGDITRDKSGYQYHPGPSGR